MMPALLDTLVVILTLTAASFADVRRREVPGWLTFGSITAGVLVAATDGAHALMVSLLGLMAGGLIILPFVLIGAFGAADALLLAAIGAWQGPQFVLWTAWWTSLVGAVLATIAWLRGQPTFPYVPAITVGVLLVLLIR